MVSLNGCNTRTHSFCRFCTTSSVGVSCNPLWLVATISSNVKFLLNRMSFFYQEFENLRIFTCLWHPAWSPPPGRLGPLEQPSIWLRPHKGERIPIRDGGRGVWGGSDRCLRRNINYHKLDINFFINYFLMILSAATHCPL